MHGSDDMELLRQYASSGSEEAFATLVSRHINLVHSVALRHAGQHDQAEEVTQVVFMILAKKAAKLRRGTVVSGWLYHTARLTAANFVRSNIRRLQRDQEAHMQSVCNDPDPNAWAQLAPVLDQAMADLNERDRNAIVLRYFDSRSFQEVGAALGTREDAAKMRVSRALEKLRKLLALKGVALSAAVVGAALSAHSVQAAPLGLAASVTGSVLHATNNSVSILTLIKTTLKIMAWTKTKVAAVTVTAALLGVGTATVAVKQIVEHHPAYPWQLRNIDTRTLDQVPPQVRILPTRAGQFGGWGMSNDRVYGIDQTPLTMLRIAYAAGSPARIVSPTDLPIQKYDFIANLPQNSLPALQQEIKNQFGVTARHEKRQADVLRLTVKNAGVEGLRPSESAGGSCESNNGRFSCVNQPLSALVSMLENCLNVPVIDRTGLAGRFDINLTWDHYDPPDPRHLTTDSLKQSLLDQLGLELVSAREPIDMLVVEHSK